MKFWVLVTKVNYRKLELRSKINKMVSKLRWMTLLLHQNFDYKLTNTSLKLNQ